MTDGILLAEMQRDRDLRRYDTIIIDEAHERSLNIDFLLGYLKQLLPRRPDLKVIITSATIDPERFAEHFAEPTARPPRSSRSPAAPTRWRSATGRSAVRPRGRGERDQVTGIVRRGRGAVDRGRRATSWSSSPASARSVTPQTPSRAMGLPHTEILPLYARLSAAEQHRVFGRHTGRRIVLATNVAETSLTVPGIRYVVDAGTARISRYSQRTKVQRLPIEPISQASANQRAGRCGRVADGICIRLYSEEDFDARPEFTDPEILRTNLASVILQMTVARASATSRAFPFVDAAGLAPDHRRRAPAGGAAAHRRPAASDPRNAARPPLGPPRSPRLPVDPRLARMVLEAERNGCLREVLVIVAALSIQDPRERPVDKQPAGRRAARPVRATSTPTSSSLLNLWHYLKEQQQELSRQRVPPHVQERVPPLPAGPRVAGPAQPAAPGLPAAGIDLDQATCARDDRPERRPASTSRCWPGCSRTSACATTSQARVPRGPRRPVRASPRARRCSRSQPTVGDVGRAGRDDPAVGPGQRPDRPGVGRAAAPGTWSSAATASRTGEKRRGAAVALEKVTLYGVPLVAGAQGAATAGSTRRCRGSCSSATRSSRATGTPTTEFFHDNRALVQRLAELEHRARRRDILVDDETLVEFYDERLPADVVSVRHFDSWWKKARREHARPADLHRGPARQRRRPAPVSAEDYPQVWEQGGARLRGDLPVRAGRGGRRRHRAHPRRTCSTRSSTTGSTGRCPACAQDLATALLKSLPKATRRHFVPTPDHAAGRAGRQRPGGGRLAHRRAGAGAARRAPGSASPPGEWDWSRVPDHLRITFRVEDRRGRPLAEGKDLAGSGPPRRRRCGRRMAQAAGAVERAGAVAVGLRRAAGDLRAAPRGTGDPGLSRSVVDHGDSVDRRGAARRSRRRGPRTRLGVRRLLLLNTTAPWKRVLARLTNAQKLALGNNPHGSVPALLDDCLACAVDSIVAERARGSVRDAGRLRRDPAAVRTHVGAACPRGHRAGRAGAVAGPRGRAGQAASLTSSGGRGAGRRPARPAAQPGAPGLRRGHRAAPGCATCERYLRAMLAAPGQGPRRRSPATPRAQEVVDRVEEAYADLLAALPPADRRIDADVVERGWMIEELRVSLFAQTPRHRLPGVGEARAQGARRARAVTSRSPDLSYPSA